MTTQKTPKPIPIPILIPILTLLLLGVFALWGAPARAEEAIFDGRITLTDDAGKSLFIWNDGYGFGADAAAAAKKKTLHSGDYTLTSNGQTIKNNSVTVMPGYEGLNGAGKALKTITLDGLSIDVSEKEYHCAFSLQLGSQTAASPSVSMALRGENQLTSGGKRAGIWVPATDSGEYPARLTISDSGGGENDKLTAQSQNDGKGQGAGIGGHMAVWNTPDEDKCGHVAVAGGTVTARGGSGIGIGEGASLEAGSFSVSGGKVRADGKNESGIQTGTVTISGGQLSAEGGDLSGHGIYGNEITISGGAVTTRSKTNTNGNGIYCPDSVKITGGSVNASGGRYGIFVTQKITIIGGSVKAAGGQGAINGKPTNGTAEVKPVTLTVEDGNGSAMASQPVTALSVDGIAGVDESDPNKIDPAKNQYGIHGMVTDSEGKIYIYLPDTARTQDAPADLVLNRVTYRGSLDVDADKDTAEAILTPFDGRLTLTDDADRSLFIWNDGYGFGKDEAAALAAKRPHRGDYTLTSNNSTIKNNGVTVMPGYEGLDGAGDTKKTITLDGLSIDVSAGADACAFDLAYSASEGPGVSLVLADRTVNTLTSGENRAGLGVPPKASLRIGGTGSLTAESGGILNHGAGIGGHAQPPNEEQEGIGTVFIDSGAVKATGHSGIGPGMQYSGKNLGDVTVGGGTVTVEGIGSGFGDIYAGNLLVAGGKLTAIGSKQGIVIEGDLKVENGAIVIDENNMPNTSLNISGNVTLHSGSIKIWGRISGLVCSGQLTVTGGTLEASGGEYGIYCGAGAVISGGAVTARLLTVQSAKGTGLWAGDLYDTDKKDIRISGGTVTATGSVDGQGIHANGDVIISGGSVKAAGLTKINKQPVNMDSQPVYLNTVKVGSEDREHEISVEGRVTIDGNSNSFGTQGTKTLDKGTLYLYLPANETGSRQIAVEADNKIYSRTYPREAGETYTVTLLPPADYSITIPAAVDLGQTAPGQGHRDEEIELQILTSKNLGNGRTLYLSVNDGIDQSNQSENFKLTGGDGGLTYQVYKGVDGDNDFKPLNSGGKIISGYESSSPLNQKGTVRLDQSKIQYSGEYGGNMVFKVGFEDAVAPDVK